MLLLIMLRWTLLLGGVDQPVIGGAEPKPLARAFHQAAMFSNNTLIVFGGESATAGALSDWWTVNVDLTCPY